MRRRGLQICRQVPCRRHAHTLSERLGQVGSPRPFEFALSTKALMEQMVQADGSTYDEVIARMARHERQRRIGAELAQRELTPGDAAVVRAGADAVARASR